MTLNLYAKCNWGHRGPRCQGIVEGEHEDWWLFTDAMVEVLVTPFRQGSEISPST